MHENLHDIDKLFREPVEAHEEMPPERIWDELDHRLDKKNIALAKRKYNKLRLFSAALLFLLISVIVLQLVSKNKIKGPAGKVAGNTNPGSAIATQPGELPNAVRKEKLMPSPVKNRTPEGPSSNEQQPDAAMENNGVTAKRAQQPAENTASATAIPEAEATKGSIITNKSTAAATKATKATSELDAGKDFSNKTAVPPGENKVAHQPTTAGLNTDASIGVSVRDKSLQIKNTTPAGHMEKNVLLGKLSSGNTKMIITYGNSKRAVEKNGVKKNKAAASRWAS